MTRLMQQITAMSRKEAARFGIPENERANYQRLDFIGGHPLGPQPTKWFRILYVDVGDGGNPVEVAEPWHPPSCPNRNDHPEGKSV
jgi:hypothetical protein